MITVSLCMIVKNEEKVIGRCLESVKNIVDEINIVDTGSTDGTKEIVQQYTDRLFDFEWIEDFAAARNHAFQQATKEYILWLDADDVVSEEDQQRFMDLRKEVADLNSSGAPIDAVSMDYFLSFDGHGNPVHRIGRYRLSRRAMNFKWVGAVHEFLDVGGNVINSEVCIHHLSLEHDISRNIRIYRAKQARGDEFGPRDLYYFANELRDHREFQEAIKYYIKFLETGKGWVEDTIQACIKMGDCYALLNNKKKEMDWLLETFTYEAPRPEPCYKLGVYFLEKNQYKPAIYWFKQAIEVEDSLWFVNDAYKTWMPLLQLCVCYDRLGQYQEAYKYNEEAAKYIPEHSSVTYNREYFKGIIPEPVVT